MRKNNIKEDILVSIIVPVYNTANYLGECLDSLINQTYTNIEIICVDDGSTDSSLSIIKYYAETDDRITYYVQENQGQSVARNVGIEKAKGNYVCFVDSDDFLIFNAIQQCVETIQKHDVDMVLFNMEIFMPNGVHFTCLTGKLYESPLPILSSYENEISVNFTNAAIGMYKLSIIKEKNIMFPNGMIYEDWVFMTNLMMSQNLRYFWLNTPIYWYRRGFTDSTTTNITNKCLDLFKAYKMADQILDKCQEGKKKKFINDIKIVNESIGFLLTRLINSTDIELVCEFIENIIITEEKFPDAYLAQMSEHLSKEKYQVVNELKNISYREYDTNNLINYFELLKNRENVRKRKTCWEGRIKKYPKCIKHKCINIIKTILPAYRISRPLHIKMDYIITTLEKIKDENSDNDYKIMGN